MGRKTRIGVIFGGKSGEHSVSRVSASYVMRELDPEKYDVVKIGITEQGEWLIYNGMQAAIVSGDWEGLARDQLKAEPERFAISILGTGNKTIKDYIDFALPILHGPNGEDGTVQGLLELIDIPYGGCSVLGCAAAMDKITAKKLFASAGLKQTPYISLFSWDIGPEIIARINSELKYPLFVKPSNMGSSVGITKVEEPAKLEAALKFAALYDVRLVVEQGVNCRELETSVIGYKDLFVGAVGEIIPHAAFYDYDAKYNDAESELLIPAPITKEQEAKIAEMAKKAYTVLGCDSYARVDFLMDKDSGDILINEINAIPGFTAISMFPKLCMAKGMSYPQILERIIELGYERYNDKNNR